MSFNSCCSCIFWLFFCSFQYNCITLYRFLKKCMCRKITIVSILSTSNLSFQFAHYRNFFAYTITVFISITALLHCRYFINPIYLFSKIKQNVLLLFVLLYCCIAYCLCNNYYNCKLELLLMPWFYLWAISFQT